MPTIWISRLFWRFRLGFLFGLGLRLVSKRLAEIGIDSLQIEAVWVEGADPGQHLLVLGVSWIRQDRQGPLIAKHPTNTFRWASPLTGHTARYASQLEGLNKDVFQGEAMNPAVAEIEFVANLIFAVHQQVIFRHIQIIDELAFRLLHQVDIKQIRIAIEAQTLRSGTDHEMI